MAKLPKIEKDNTGQGVGLADAPSVLGKARKNSKSLPNTLLAPQPKEDGRRKDNIIQFPSDRISNNKKPPISREDCCEKTVTLLKEISKSTAIDEKKTTGGKEKSETNKLLKEMNATLKSMLNIQAAEFQGTLETKNEKKPGLGGIAEKVNQEAESLIKLIGEGILIASTLAIKPLINSIEGLLKWWNDNFGPGPKTPPPGKEAPGGPPAATQQKQLKESIPQYNKRIVGMGMPGTSMIASSGMIPGMEDAANKIGKPNTPQSSRDEINPYGSAVKDLIARGESSNDTAGGGYNSANRPNAGEGKPNEPIVVDGLKDKTIKEVQAMQSKGEIFAAGKYNITPAPLNEAVTALKLTGNEKFDEKMQEKIYDEYLTGIKPGRENINAFKRGKSNDVDAAALDIAKEFASAPDPTDSGGRSFYKDGLNKASISLDEIRAALLEDQQTYKAKDSPWLAKLNANLDKIKNDAIKTAAAQTNNKQAAAAPSVTNNTTVNQGEKKSPSVNTFASVDPDMSSVIRSVGQF